MTNVESGLGGLLSWEAQLEDDRDVMAEAGANGLTFGGFLQSNSLNLDDILAFNSHPLKLIGEWLEFQESSSNLRTPQSSKSSEAKALQQHPLISDRLHESIPETAASAKKPPRPPVVTSKTFPRDGDRVLSHQRHWTQAQPRGVRQALPSTSVKQLDDWDEQDDMEDDEADGHLNWRRGAKRKQLPITKAPSRRMCTDSTTVKSSFQTAGEKLGVQFLKEQTRHNRDSPIAEQAHVPASGDRGDKAVRRGVRSGFVSPVRGNDNNAGGGGGGGAMFRSGKNSNAASNNQSLPESTQQCLQQLMDEDGQLPARLRNIEPRLIEHICNEIMTQDTKTRWTDIAGLQDAKQCVTEAIIWPLKRPDLFRGTRAPVTGLLLYGPPGTGKTMIGRAIAGETNATFFSISASSLTSKWIGEGEKLVRALFGVACCMEPAVIFIDEVDALLSQRTAEGEHESSRRLKTQFLIEMEGCGSGDQRVLVIGATNRPQELDEAARRRLPNRLYIPLPQAEARGEIIRNLLSKDSILSLSDEDVTTIAQDTQGYSGSDIRHVVREAAMMPLREAAMAGNIDVMESSDIRSVSLKDFQSALKKIKSSVAASELTMYEEWTTQFGMGSLTG